jgi:hypothetical protein
VRAVRLIHQVCQTSCSSDRGLTSGTDEVLQASPTLLRQFSEDIIGPLHDNSHTAESTTVKQIQDADFDMTNTIQQRFPSDALPSLASSVPNRQSIHNLASFNTVPSDFYLEGAPSGLTDDDSCLADFLNGIVLPLDPSHMQDPSVDCAMLPSYTTGDLLDFGIDFMDLPTADTVLTEPQPEATATASGSNLQDERPGTRTPATSDGVGVGTEAFTRSLWRYLPTSSDNSSAEQLHLSLPHPDVDSPEVRTAAASLLLDESLTPSVRDRVLATVLKTCDPALYDKIVTSFPRVELLNNLLHHAVNSSLAHSDFWLHLPTFNLNVQRSELVIMLIAAGATNCSVPSVRQLGFALQEAVRTALSQTVCFPPQRFVLSH